METMDGILAAIALIIVLGGLWMLLSGVKEMSKK
jgi:hypothetical protein